MISPTVTAILRTYNRVDLVGRAIGSVLSQTFQDFELIIMDDCSSDDTCKIAQEYVKRDNRIQYIRQHRKQGHIKLLNIATSMARGKYIAYLDDDDVWRTRKLELQVNRFESGAKRMGLVTGGIQYWNLDRGEKLHTWIPSMRGNIYWKTLGGSGRIFGPPSVVMIKRQVFDDVGSFREDMPRGAGQHLFRRIAKKYEIDFVEKIVLDYFYQQKSLTSINSYDDIKKHIKSRLIKIESTRNDLEKVPGLYAGELRKLGESYCQADQYSCAWKTFRKAVKINGGSALFFMIRSLLRRHLKGSILGKTLIAVRNTLRRFLVKYKK